MIIYMGSFPIADDSQQTVGDALARAREETLAEAGCHAYDFGFDVADDTSVVFHEVYEDRAAFDAHMQAEHTQALFSALADHVTGRASAQMYEAEPVRRERDA